MKDEPKVLDQERYSGIAALSICEALMLALNDHNILPEKGKRRLRPIDFQGSAALVEERVSF